MGSVLRENSREEDRPEQLGQCLNIIEACNSSDMQKYSMLVTQYIKDRIDSSSLDSNQTRLTASTILHQMGHASSNYTNKVFENYFRLKIDSVENMYEQFKIEYSSCVTVASIDKGELAITFLNIVLEDKNFCTQIAQNHALSWFLANLLFETKGFESLEQRQTSIFQNLLAMRFIKNTNAAFKPDRQDRVFNQCMEYIESFYAVDKENIGYRVNHENESSKTVERINERKKRSEAEEGTAPAFLGCLNPHIPEYRDVKKEVTRTSLIQSVRDSIWSNTMTVVGAGKKDSNLAAQDQVTDVNVGLTGTELGLFKP